MKFSSQFIFPFGPTGSFSGQQKTLPSCLDLCPFIKLTNRIIRQWKIKRKQDNTRITVRTFVKAKFRDITSVRTLVSIKNRRIQLITSLVKKFLTSCTKKVNQDNYVPAGCTCTIESKNKLENFRFAKRYLEIFKGVLCTSTVGHFYSFIIAKINCHDDEKS